MSDQAGKVMAGGARVNTDHSKVENLLKGKTHLLKNDQSEVPLIGLT